MKKIVLLDTSYPINNRNEKIMRSLSLYEKNIITWNRDNRKIQKNNNCKEYFYNATVNYGDIYKKLLMIFSYAFFINKCLIRIKPDYIIASHWPMLVIAALIKSKNSDLIYDNRDVPTSKIIIIRKIIMLIERAALRKVNCIMLASRFYKKKYIYFKKNIYIIENKPYKTILENVPKKYFQLSNQLKISFIGTVRYYNCMINLIEAANGLPIDVLFFGEGPELKSLKDYTKNHKNIYFYDKYNYNDIKCIYDLTDIVWAVYPNKDYNVKYAISNKFFESIVFEKPSFYANNTELGKFVNKCDIGFTVNPYNIDEIRNYFNNIINNKNILKIKTENIKKYKSQSSLFWDDYNEIFFKIIN